MQEVSKFVNLAYIATEYFKKTKAWLYQRINGNVVNGKAARFTNEELKTLKFALDDISKKLGSFSV